MPFAQTSRKLDPVTADGTFLSSLGFAVALALGLCIIAKCFEIGRVAGANDNESKGSLDGSHRSPGALERSGCLRGPGMFNTDFALLKNTRISERTPIQLRAEFFNAFNNVNFGGPDNTLTDSAFGQITSANDPRILQFALKLVF